MGKKMKKKAPNPRKALHRAPAGSPRSVMDQTAAEVVVEHDGERNSCNHYSKSIDELNRILLRVRSTSSDIVACEHCRDEPVNRRGGKEKGKQQKKKGGGRVSEPKQESNFVWVCLECNRYFCGGEVSVSEPYGHARRHSKQEHHMWAVRSDDPLISWCYSCNSTVPIEMPEEDMGVLPRPAVDSDDGSESVELESCKGYVVRGLSNLGNTCFFNSVMQNLLATDMLRDYLASLNRPPGPITMALKKLFAETSSLVDSKNVLSPKSLFGSICAKAPQFRGYQQQDSHELLLYLLDGLHVEETSARKLQDSSNEQEKTDSVPVVTFVDSIFGGQISSTVCCIECGHTSIVHEPYLDLSLPVPSKKPPPKKVLPPPPKRGKPPLKERNKGRRFREKAVAKGATSTQHCKEESSNMPSEWSEPVGPAPKPDEDVAMKVEDNFSWMDFIRDPDPQGSDSEQFLQSESTAQDGVALHLVNCSNELNVSSDSCGETSCRDEVPCTSSQDPNIILLPYKELDPTAEEINGASSCSQTAENVAFLTVDKEASHSAENASSVVPAEVDFDGFGVLFNEPEVTSGPRTENGTGEELDLTLLAGNSSESNHDEVDDTNAPVSINSCLALFTKPELLSDEQAWHCDQCSQNVVQRKGKGKAVAEADDVSVLDEGESNFSPSVEVDSTEIKASGNGKMTSSFKNFVSQHQRSDDPTTELQKPLNHIGDSDSKNETQNDESSNVFGPDVVRNYEEIGTSDSSTQYFSFQSSHENSVAQEISSNYGTFNRETDTCSANDVNDMGSVGCDQPAVADAFGRNDGTSVPNQFEREGLLASDKGHSLDSKGSDEVKRKIKKVKRDATKRILIYRTPPILTIHLKRFSQDARGRLTKLSGHVSFQETLDLRPYMDPRSEEKDKCIYRLIGAVEHSGSMHGGHYIAYVKGERGRGKMQKGAGQAWFYASDAHVREASLSEVLNTDAYILFYERVQV